MNAVYKFSSTVVLAGALAATSFSAFGAAGNAPTSGSAVSNPSMSATQSATMNAPNASAQNAPVVQKMRDDLSKAGFTDIHIMPSSFLVRAKDSSGNPVMMVVNPDSITAITEENAGANAANASNPSHGAAIGAGATLGPKSTGGSQPVTPGGSQAKP